MMLEYEHPSRVSDCNCPSESPETLEGETLGVSATVGVMWTLLAPLSLSGRTGAFSESYGNGG